MDRRQQGNVAITTALALVPLLALVGLSVDAGRAYLIESKLSQALLGRVAIPQACQRDRIDGRMVLLQQRKELPAGTCGAASCRDRFIIG